MPPLIVHEPVEKPHCPVKYTVVAEEIESLKNGAMIPAPAVANVVESIVAINERSGAVAELVLIQHCA